MQTLGAQIRATFASIEHHADQGTEATGLPTGFDQLDRATGGLHPGTLTVIAGVPASGKSALTASIARFTGTRLSRPTLYVDTLGSAENLALRLLASESRISTDRLRAGKLDEPDWRRFGDAMATIADAPLHLEASATITLDTIDEDARTIDGLDLIIVDGLAMLTDSERGDDEARWDAAARVVHHLKRLAREHQVPVIVTASVGKGPSSRTWKQPLIDDIAETSSLIYDADLVIGLYRDEMYDADSPDRGIAELSILKHREGPSAVVKLAFLDHLSMFANLAQGPLRAV
jgi:replicative DNA helicase